jgi:hypothetical protein
MGVVAGAALLLPHVTGRAAREAQERRAFEQQLHRVREIMQDVEERKRRAQALDDGRQ